MTHPTNLEGTSLSFNYDPELLKEAGVDLSTSEGKAKAVEVIVAALEFYKESLEGHEPPPEYLALIEALTVVA